jgi:hypothetical protein
VTATVGEQALDPQPDKPAGVTAEEWADLTEGLDTDERAALADKLNNPEPREVEPPATLIKWQISRQYRREQQGKPCMLCGLKMHHSEVIAIRPDISPEHPAAKQARIRSVFVHERCADMLLFSSEGVEPPISEHEDAKERDERAGEG